MSKVFSILLGGVLVGMIFFSLDVTAQMVNCKVYGNSNISSKNLRIALINKSSGQHLYADEVREVSLQTKNGKKIVLNSHSDVARYFFQGVEDSLIIHS